MSIEYSPVDVACNIRCKYCYENPMRDAGNISTKADWNKAKSVLKEIGYSFSLHGGEPLLAPIEHLEEVFQFGYENFGYNSIQTNGILITDEVVKLFKRYNVGIGISVDGPGSLNDYRCEGQDTQKTFEGIHRLLKNNIVPSLIVTVHRLNGLPDVRKRMLDWFGELEFLNILHVNLHTLEVECGMGSLALTEKENIAFFSDVYEWSKKHTMKFEPFTDIKRLLLATETDRIMCIWNACDPLSTPAVNGVSRNGTRSNCGRTNKEGINWVKADQTTRERSFILMHTPQEYGGCKDCTYFNYCQGNCPGEAIDGDWRNRSVHCETYYAMFQMIEKDVGRVIKDRNHVDVPHGDGHNDNPHIDWHGDSNSESKGVEVSWSEDSISVSKNLSESSG